MRPSPTLALTFFALLMTGVRLAGAQPIEAVTQPSVDLRLAFAVPGVVATVVADPGARVEPGAALVALDDREARAVEELQRLRAQSTLEVDAAEAEWRLAQNEEARVRDAFEKGAAGAFEVERAALQTGRRKVELDLATRRREEAALLLRQATLRREQYTLTAPAAGVVEQVLVEPGEGVEAQRPVVRLVSVDPLRIEAPVPTERTLSISHGDRATITWLLPTGKRSLEARVVSVATVADAASDTRLVRLEAPNPEGLPAGARVAVEFAAAGVR